MVKVLGEELLVLIVLWGHFYVQCSVVCCMCMVVTNLIAVWCGNGTCGENYRCRLAW